MRNFIVTIDGKSYSVGVEEVGEVKSMPKTVPIASPAPVAPKANLDGEKVLSPFPAIIKTLIVKDGAVVKKNDPILIIEAMKVDNEITAPCDGTITFNVAKGASVETDAVLAVIA